MHVGEGRCGVLPRWTLPHVRYVNLALRVALLSRIRRARRGVWKWKMGARILPIQTLG